MIRRVVGPPDARGRGCLAGLVGGLAPLLLLAALVVASGLFVYFGPGPAARQGTETTVLLDRGSGLSEIASTLKSAGVVRSAPLFMAAAQLSGQSRRLKAGEYAVPSRAPVREILARIASGQVVHHRITIPEGLTSQQAMDVLTASDLLAGQAATPPEGAILPETYDVVRGEQRAAVLGRMMDARDKLLAGLWVKRRAGLPFRSPAEAVVLASIVEKETALASERPRVAAVYLNRLAIGMRLQSDPSVIYGINGGRPLGRGILLSELNRPTPFNTYLNTGLPPTPIANPGRASLAAVLDPPKTDELYFVADGSGGHVFSSTYEAHERNVAKWRKIEQGAR